MEQKNSEKKWEKWMLPVGIGIVLIGLSAFLLKGNVWTFWTWWLMAAVFGLAAMPVTGRLFCGFADRGWIFSKVLAIAGTGFLTWFLVATGLLPFTATVCRILAIICGIACLIFLYTQSGQGKVDVFPANEISLVIWEEVIFLAAFLLWTYLAGFRPQAYGTEKFMDYGFMEAMMRSTTLPARDLWYSKGVINYYYGGQYFAVYLTKLSGTKVALTYNLMRTFVAGWAFVMPFSLVYQMMRDRLAGKKHTMDRQRKVSVLAGLTAGMAVSIAGNAHYIVYACVIPLIEKIKGEEISGYWFPDATRYIGYNPDVPDKTIHEFPCYSFVLGDLHAHVVNIMFVLLLIGLLYAWLKLVKEERKQDCRIGSFKFWGEELAHPHIFIVAVLLGMFQWTNYWDFVIYFVVACGTVLFANIIRFQGKVRRVLGSTILYAVFLMLISYLVILPFTMKFETMVDGVALAKNHSLPYQLLILWGLPTVLTIVFVAALLLERLPGMKPKSLYRLMGNMRASDLFAVITGLCAIGLVMIPEIVYVRDIYENGNARANTMFKLTYQAYILFGITMGYVIWRLLIFCWQRSYKIIGMTGLFLLIWTFGYFGRSVTSWFGDVWNPKLYQGLDATTYLETDFAEDAPAIRWLRANIEGSPVVLEANGDSYTGYERVSASTGLPTILGWYVHEWLWRSNVADVNNKSADVESIYTSQDSELVERLIADYEVSYIFIGSKEREKYGDEINETLLRELGTVVYTDSTSGTYIIKIN